MTDRRQGERRRFPSHGRRKDYQAGCTCLRCRKAEADYRRHLRGAIARGYLPLGRLVSAGPTWKRLKTLLREGFTKAELARRFGLKRPRLEVQTERVTASTVQRTLAFYESIMAEGPERPV